MENIPKEKVKNEIFQVLLDLGNGISLGHYYFEISQETAIYEKKEKELEFAFNIWKDKERRKVHMVFHFSWNNSWVVLWYLQRFNIKSFTGQ